MIILWTILLVYMIDGNVERWHRCEFPHSWNKEIEHIIDTKQFRIYYG